MPTARDVSASGVGVSTPFLFSVLKTSSVYILWRRQVTIPG